MTSVVLAGGGTAGHTSPLIATARALASLEPDVELLCIGTSKGVETTVIPAAGLPLQLVEPAPMPRGKSLAWFSWVGKVWRGARQARRILRSSGADVVVGFGGYVSFPVYAAAFLARVPVVIHEANVIPGIANRACAKYAAHVATAFQSTPLAGATLTGMPMSRSISHPTITAERAREKFGLDPQHRTLLVSGGSQGAQVINDAVRAALPELLGAGIQVLHVLGPKNMSEEYQPHDVAGVAYRPVAFIDDMAEAYAAADIMVGRGGAGTVMETAVSGLPVIFIPYGWGNGEQVRNTAELVEAGAGVRLPQDELTAERLVQEVLALVQEPGTLAEMSKLARAQYPADAAERLARAVLAVAHKEDH